MLAGGELAWPLAIASRSSELKVSELRSVKPIHSHVQGVEKRLLKVRVLKEPACRPAAKHDGRDGGIRA